MHLLILLSLFLQTPANASCRLTSRPQTLEPATMKMISELHATIGHEEDEPSCEQSLKEKEKDVNTWLGFFRQNPEDLGGPESKWIAELLSRKPANTAASACALDAELAEAGRYFEDFDRRSAEIDDRLNSVAHALLNSRAEQLIFDNRKMAVALLDCRDEYMISTASWDSPTMDESYEAEERRTCLGQTGAPLELWDAIKLLARNPDGLATGLYCLIDETNESAARKNLTLAQGIETGDERILRGSVKYLETTQKAAPAILGQIKKRRQELKSFQCEELQEKKTNLVEQKIRKLYAEEGWGSGFVLRGPRNKGEIITARHVAFEGEGHESSRIKVVGVKAEKQSRHGDIFPTTPGSYDRSRDLIKRDMNKPSPAFTAVSEDEIALAGAKVTIHGYPASRDGKFTTHHCEVKGIGRNIFVTNQTESYLVHCPGAPEHIGGMSGGPVLNEKGEVIGAVSAHNPFTNMVVVQPISRNAKGENQFGFRKVFLYDSCFEEANTTAPRHCQVIPGMTYLDAYP